MIMRNILRIKLIILLTVFIGSSCRIIKLNKDKKIENSIKTEVIDSLYKNNIDYKTLFIRYSAKITGTNKKLSFKGSMRLKKDSILWISISPGLGIEVARGVLTPDTLKFIDKLKSKYFCGDYKYMANKFNIDLKFRDLQSVITNRLFIYKNNGDINKEKKILKDYKFTTDSLYYIFENIDTNFVKNKLYQKILVSKKLFKLKNIFINDPLNQYQLTVNYNKYLNKNKLNTARSILIKVKDKKGKGEFKLNLLKIQKNRKMKYPFDILDKYKKMKY